MSWKPGEKNVSRRRKQPAELKSAVNEVRWGKKTSPWTWHHGINGDINHNSLSWAMGAEARWSGLESEFRGEEGGSTFRRCSWEVWLWTAAERQVSLMGVGSPEKPLKDYGDPTWIWYWKGSGVPGWSCTFLVIEHLPSIYLKARHSTGDRYTIIHRTDTIIALVKLMLSRFTNKQL